MNAGYATIETLARDSYGRLVAYLAARSGDVAGAEDALSDAFLAALQRWPTEGLPDKPEAWLLTTARRRLIDHARHSAVHSRSIELLEMATEMAQKQCETNDIFPDERLKLLFVCAHPAIDPAIRTPLMLQTVFGLDAARIASAFLTSPSTMGQRLVRAKTKIRDAGIPFTIPEKRELPARLQFVLEAIYTTFTSGWEDAEESAEEGLVAEALWLGRVVCQLLTDTSEALGLLALMLHCQARRAARFDSEGRYIPLPEQDTRLWSGEMISEAESCLTQAARLNQPGRFQLEAAIQSVHAQRRLTEKIEWSAIGTLYGGLLHFAPTVGAKIGQAIALAQTQGALLGLSLLEKIETASVQNHQPYWAALAYLRAEAELFPEARSAYHRAIGLSESPAQRAFLQKKAQGLPN